MIETFLGTEHINYFSQSEKPLVMPWSWTVLFHYASQPPSISYLMSRLYVGGRAVFCVQTILTYVFAAVVHTEASFVDIELMEISTFHLTEACISIQNKQFILRNTATWVLLCECVCSFCFSDCLATPLLLMCLKVCLWCECVGPLCLFHHHFSDWFLTPFFHKCLEVQLLLGFRIRSTIWSPWLFNLP